MEAQEFTKERNMIDPNADLKPTDRISITVELMNAIYGTLAELPAKHSMELLLAIKDQSEIVKEDSQE